MAKGKRRGDAPLLVDEGACVAALGTIADRFESLAQSGTPAKRRREYLIESQRAGRILAAAVTGGWISLHPDFARWAVQQNAQPARGAEPTPVDPHVRLFAVYADVFHGKDPLVRSEPMGLSHYKNIPPTDGDALTSGRLKTAADVCRVLARRLALSLSQQPAKQQFVKSTELRCTSDPLWNDLHKFLAMVESQQQYSIGTWVDLLSDIRERAIQHGLRPAGKVTTIVCFKDSRYEFPPEFAACFDRGRSPVVLVQPGAWGFQQHFDLADSFLLPNGSPSVAIEWAQQWIRAREAQLAGIAQFAATEDWYRASWYNKATNGGLYPDLLRVAHNDGRLTGRKLKGRLEYELSDVCREYGQYRAVLLAAKANQPEAKRSKTKLS